jgi:tRNA(Ile)-lysidine synthase
VRLSRKALIGLDDARAANVLRVWIRAQALPAPSAARLGDMLRQLREARTGYALSVMHAGARLRLYRDNIYWEKRLPEPIGLAPRRADESVQPVGAAAASQAGAVDDEPNPPAAREEKRIEHLAWRGQEVWHLPQWRGSLVFIPAAEDDTGADTVPAALLASAPLSARVRTGGERMQQAPGRAARTLKNLFQEGGVPAWERDVPLVYLGDTLLYVPHIGLNGAVVRSLPPSQLRGERRRLEWRMDLLIA